MPALNKLTLRTLPQLESLRFLSVAPLPNTLTSLTLDECRHAQLQASELRHVYGLQQLTSLRLQDSFAEKLDSMSLMDLRLPSHRLPNLIHSVIDCAAPAAAMP